MYTDIKSTLDKYDLNNSQEQGSSEGRLSTNIAQRVKRGNAINY